MTFHFSLLLTSRFVCFTKLPAINHKVPRKLIYGQINKAFSVDEMDGAEKNKHFDAFSAS